MYLRFDFFLDGIWLKSMIWLKSSLKSSLWLLTELLEILLLLLSFVSFLSTLFLKAINKIEENSKSLFPELLSKSATQFVCFSIKILMKALNTNQVFKTLKIINWFDKISTFEKSWKSTKKRTRIAAGKKRALLVAYKLPLHPQNPSPSESLFSAQAFQLNFNFKFLGSFDLAWY